MFFCLLHEREVCHKHEIDRNWIGEDWWQENLEEACCAQGTSTLMRTCNPLKENGAVSGSKCVEGWKKKSFFFPNGVTASNLAVWPLQIYLCKRYLEGNSARVFSTFHLTLSRSIAWISMVFAPTLSHSISLYLRLSHQISTLSLLYLWSISQLSHRYLLTIPCVSLRFELFPGFFLKVFQCFDYQSSGISFVLLTATYI